MKIPVMGKIIRYKSIYAGYGINQKKMQVHTFILTYSIIKISSVTFSVDSS